MSEIKSESISSLVDNYSPSSDDSVSAHIIDNMLKDEDSSNTWQNYHLIGDVLRDEAPQTLALDLSDKISAAIAQEATILSPNSSTQASVKNLDSAENIIEDEHVIENTNRVVDATNRFKAKMSDFIKPMGQVAIAASAAVLMIVGVQNNVADNSSAITPSQVVQTMPLAGYANPVSFNVHSNQQPSGPLNKEQTQQALNEKIVADRVAQQRRLQALLKDHQQQVQLGSKIK